MAQFLKTGSIRDLQQFGDEVYTLTDDRLFSLWDLLTNQERFTMRALKGVRKHDDAKLKKNLLIAFSWALAIANRLHIDADANLWQRFPGVCSYCGKCPCECREQKVIGRKAVAAEGEKPQSLAEFQQMFARIYPSEKRTVFEAGVHLAEEMGECGEAVQNFLGEHKAEQFTEIEDEFSDYISCIFGLANSAGIDIAGELAAMYVNNCHVCHKAPCECNFSMVASFRS